MADLGMNFDPRAVEPSTGNLPPIPEAWYNVQIVESEMKATKANDGAFLQLSLQVLDGEYAGRKVTARLNLHNKNPVAVDIAQKELSAICHAVGVFEVVRNSQQLHGRPFQARVTVSPADGKYEASNDVKGYRPTQQSAGFAPPPGASQTFAPPAAAPAPTFVPPAAAPPAAPTFSPPPAGTPAVAPPWGAPPLAQPPAPGTTPPWAQ